MNKFLYILIFLIPLKLFSQSDTTLNNIFVQANGGYGFIFEHRSSISYLVKGHIPEFKIKIGKTTDGKKQWQNLYNLPDIGFGYYYANLQNPEILGNVNAAYFFIDVPYVNSSKINFSYNFELGIAYLSKKFDITNNYFNKAIGSHFNAYINLGLLLDLKLSKKITLTNSLNFTHYSNGKFAKPNLGLNVINAQTGVKYYLSENTKPVVKKVNNKDVKQKNIFTINFSVGLQQVKTSDEKKYMCNAFNINYGRILNKKKIIGIGIDFFNNSGYNVSLSTPEKTYDSSYNLRMGMHISADFVFNKISFTTQAGYYLYSKYTGSEIIYNRFGIIYRFSKHLYTNLTLKTHIVVADNIEFGLGYYFLK